MRAKILNSNKVLPEYALYRGDEFIDLGTADELAKKMNVHRNTIKFYATKTHRERLEKRNSNYNKCLIAIKIEEDEENEYKN